MESFLTSIRSTPVGELARAFRLHRGLLYEDEKAIEGDKESVVPGGDDCEKKIVLVEWAGPEDEDHPRNYSTLTKTLLSVNVFVLTFMTYMVSSIYTLGISGPGSVQEEFGVSLTTGVLGLSLYVIAYGLGPVLFHALIENPRIGRLPVYIASTLIFFAIQIATVYSPNIHTLLALRFLAGLIGSPSLATGGASLGDVYNTVGHTRAISVWAFGAVFGPCIGPVLGGFAFEWAGWRGTIWQVMVASDKVSVMTSGFALCCVLLTMPETFAPAVLYRRARRLQAADPTRIYVTHLGDDKVTVVDLLREAAWDPVKLFPEPTLMVYNSYLALIYGLFYLFFESFPIVFVEKRGFEPHQLGLSFLGVFVGAFFAVSLFRIFIETTLVPLFESNGGELPSPRVRLYPTAFGALLIPVSMFGLGWTGQYGEIHWIVPIIFSALFPFGAMLIFPSTLGYLGDVYRDHQNAVYTLNDLCRSSLAGAFPLFAHAMFAHLGLGGACSLLGGVAILFIPAPFLFIKYDTRIRAASRYTNKAGLHGNSTDSISTTVNREASSRITASLQ